MKLNILIVDDSIPMRKVIKKTIQAAGFSIATIFEAGDGVEALNVLDDKKIDIVITDYNMPNMNGLALVKEMKKDETLYSIPVLVITTEGRKVRAEEFTAIGVDGYIVKPFRPEALRAKLLDILGDSNVNKGFEREDENLDF